MPDKGHHSKVPKVSKADLKYAIIVLEKLENKFNKEAIGADSEDL